MSLLRLSLTLLILTHTSCLESTCEAAEGSEAGGVRRSNGQCHQQVFKDCCFVVTRIHYYKRTSCSGNKDWKTWTGSSKSWRSTTSRFLKRQLQPEDAISCASIFVPTMKIRLIVASLEHLQTSKVEMRLSCIYILLSNSIPLVNQFKFRIKMKRPFLELFESASSRSD